MGWKVIWDNFVGRKIMGNSQNTKPSPIQHFYVGIGKVLEDGVSPISELSETVGRQCKPDRFC